MRFSDGKSLLLDGLLDKAGSIAEHAVVVNAHLGQGNVLLFGNNPVYRGETVGKYARYSMQSSTMGTSRANPHRRRNSHRYARRVPSPLAHSHSGCPILARFLRKGGRQLARNDAVVAMQDARHDKHYAISAASPPTVAEAIASETTAAASA